LGTHKGQSRTGRIGHGRGGAKHHHKEELRGATGFSLVFHVGLLCWVLFFGTYS